MEAPSSTSSRLSGASGWTEAASSEDLLLLEGVCLPQSGTVEDSGAVSGIKPDLEPWGLVPFTPGVREVALRLLQDHLLLPRSSLRRHFSVIRSAGETAGGTEFTSDESREPLDDALSSARGKLHNYDRH